MKRRLGRFRPWFTFCLSMRLGYHWFCMLEQKCRCPASMFGQTEWIGDKKWAADENGTIRDRLLPTSSAKHGENFWRCCIYYLVRRQFFASAQSFHAILFCCNIWQTKEDTTDGGIVVQQSPKQRTNGKRIVNGGSLRRRCGPNVRFFRAHSCVAVKNENRTVSTYSMSSESQKVLLLYGTK